MEISLEAIQIFYPMTTTTTSPHALVCFSHLRWNFVYQRPQHLLSRFTSTFKVYYIEEPVYGEHENSLKVSKPAENLWVVVPHFREGITEEEGIAMQKELLASFFIENDITQYIFWYYTPMALSISDHFNPSVIVYDCMDELSAFKFAPQSLKDREKELLKKADLVFAGGYSLYEAKKNRHPDVHAFPSSIDVGHFNKARIYTADPVDQESIPHPRIGYFGVIDERMDLVLIEGIARRKPDWHIVMVGPVVKISPDTLPKLPNIHYLGLKSYDELPAYISGWDIAMLPFAHNESTRYISPTKTPEYLAAGKPVISTPIIDVLRQYGRNGLVNIAGTPEEFVRVASMELENHDREEWLEQVNEFLSHNSWDKTWQRMMYLVTRKLNEKERSMKNINEHIYV
ncbi:MAG: glycosyltransferase family 1 protein [Bacteroidota bacterium]|nr:glycosyltransferase family 1 protein [Bacteroidota bacterium]